MARSSATVTILVSGEMKCTRSLGSLVAPPPNPLVIEPL
jgi:hypothetical protein